MAFCLYPIPNKFASAAQPKLCGVCDRVLLSAVPYQRSQFAAVEMRIQPLCLRHSCEVAVFKFAQSLYTPFTDDEILYLKNNGFDVLELVDASNWHGPPKPKEC